MKHIKSFKVFEDNTSGRITLSKARLFALMRLIIQTEIKKIHNTGDQLEVVYYAPKVDVSDLFPHMHVASFEYISIITQHWAEVEIRSWDPYEIDNRKVYILKTGRYTRKESEYQAIVHIFMKRLIDSGLQINI